MTRSNKSRADTMKQARRCQRRRRRLQVATSSLLMALSSGSVSASNALLEDHEKQELAHFARMLHQINTTNSWSYDASRFISAYSSGDESYMNDLLLEKELEVDMARSLKVLNRRRLTDVETRSSGNSKLLSEEKNETSLQRELLDQSSNELEQDQERDLRGIGATRSFSNTRTKPKSIQNGTPPRSRTRTNHYYTRNEHMNIGNGLQNTAVNTGYYNPVNYNPVNYGFNTYSSNQYAAGNYFPDSYAGKAGKAVREYMQPVQYTQQIQYPQPVQYGPSNYVRPTPFANVQPQQPINTYPGKAAKAVGAYMQPVQYPPQQPIINTNPGGNYLDLGGGYYMFNGRYYYYGTLIQCWYGENNISPSGMIRARTGIENDSIMLRRRQPSQYSAQNRYSKTGKRKGSKRELHWEYSPNYFQSGTSYYVGKAGKGGKGGKDGKTGLTYYSKSAKTGAGAGIGSGSMWLYPWDPMYDVICGSPVDDDGYYDDAFTDDGELTDTTKPSRKPTNTKRPTPKPNKTKKPTKRPNNKPTPTENNETPQPTEEDATPQPTDEDATPKPTVRCPDGCPDCDPDSPLPCPPAEMKRICDKAGEDANFIDCYRMCKPSYCCIHDSGSKTYSPSCSQTYENCFLYYPCYIIWWKLADTIGPATYLRVEQDEPFYNVDFAFLENDWEEDEDFFQQLFGHHFDGDDAPTDETFEDEENW